MTRRFFVVVNHGVNDLTSELKLRLEYKSNLICIINCTTNK